MNHTLINNHLHISFPDDFQFLTRDELQELYRSDNKDMWGIRDKAHKILLTVFHHKSSGFMVKVFGNPKEIAEQNERKLAAFYRDYGYEQKEFFSSQIDGKDAYGFRYDYTVQGVTQSCESVVTFYKDTCYTFYYYTRPDLWEDNKPIYEEILKSVQFQD